MQPCFKAGCEQDEECQVDETGMPQCLCPGPCPPIHRPVCGSDQKTYSSTCELLRESCLLKRNISLIYEGVCGKKLYSKVCWLEPPHFYILIKYAPWLIEIYKRIIFISLQVPLRLAGISAALPVVTVWRIRLVIRLVTVHHVEGSGIQCAALTAWPILIRAVSATNHAATIKPCLLTTRAFAVSVIQLHHYISLNCFYDWLIFSVHAADLIDDLKQAGKLLFVFGWVLVRSIRVTK